MFFAFLVVAFMVTLRCSQCLGPLPDASQEGLLWPWKGYASVALFHFHVPEESTRATFEFASFQDKPDCPQRQVIVWLQKGSYPVINASSANEFPPTTYFTDQSNLDWLTLESAFEPSETIVHPVYAPEAGSWFAAAYLTPTNEPQGFLRQQCRYSLGSRALWNRADQVSLIQPNQLETFTTSRHFSYYKFYVPEDTNQFTVSLSNCQMLLKTPRNVSCIEYVGLRAKALPLHQRTTDFQHELKNLSRNATATLVEDRPYEAVHYYLLVVTHGRVKFDVELNLRHCGNSGIYGPAQRKWYLAERGLVWESEPKEPKEPITGFQLFTSSRLSKSDENGGETFQALTENITSLSMFDEECISKFDFTRIDNVRAFSVIYMVQGRSWYTKWLTILEEAPIFTRFKTFDYTDLGGSLNIRVKIDTDLVDHSSIRDGFYHVVVGCLSQGRQPRVIESSRKLACDDHSSSQIKVADLDTEIGAEALKVVPFPQPGPWYIGFQMHCRNVSTSRIMPCPKSSISTMISVDVNIQPCDHRPLRDACGGSGHGVCTTNHKGTWSFASCSCAPGYSGWTCDQVDAEAPHSPLNTLLLTLSNLFFLPAIFLAFYRRAYGQCLVYTSTMIFSTFYHACDQESFSGSLPALLQKTCLSFYVNNEVLQFCDFFSAILSFWVTVVSLSSLPAEVTNALNLFGALLVAFLVQYNRTGRLVLLIPVPLGLLIMFLSQITRSLKRKRCYWTPNRRLLFVYLPAALCLVMAIILATVIGTDQNYPYVHSGWHLLISLALAFLVIKTGRNRNHSAKVQVQPPVSFMNEEIATVSTNVDMASNEDITVNNDDNDEEGTDDANNDKGSLMKRLSYLQKFSALIARHES